MTDILDPPMPSHSDTAATAPEAAGNKAPKHKAAKRPVATRLGLWSLVTVSVAAALLAAFYALWAHDIHNHNVVRDVALAQRNVSGQTPVELAKTLALIQEEFANTPITINTPTVTVTATAAEMGVTIDSVATKNATLAIGHRGSSLSRPWNWLGSLVGAGHQAQLNVSVDEKVFAAKVRDLESGQSRKPVNADVTLVADKFTVTPAVPGNVIGLDAAIKKLRALKLAALAPIAVDSQPVVAQAAFGDGDAQALADRLNALAAHPLTVSVDGKSQTVPPAMVSSWLSPVIEDNTTTVALDGAKATADLSAMFGKAGTIGAPPTFRVDYPNGQGKDKPGVVTIVPGTDSTVCCEAAPSTILAALSTADTTTLDMKLKTVPAAVAADQAKALGITERISWFSTPHNCCENRVINIHLIADATRGMIIQPGETFSLNKAVGERTPAKGYVKAAGIYYGAHVNQYGGGTSQYTTTLFNAAFFAGMDIVEYQMHSEYFTRYPFGREATLSWTKPDLRIKNNSDRPIMIWSYYSGTQLSVELYGTKYVTTSDQTNQITSPVGTCTYVKTERTRVYVDPKRKSEIDYFTNTYTRPLEEDCKGTPAKKYDENFNVVTTTTTTLPPATTTLPGATTAPTAPPPSTP